MALSKSGYIKAVAVHMKTSLGRPMENAEEIVRQVKQYEAKNPDLIVFGELSISGYSCGDLFLPCGTKRQVLSGSLLPRPSGRTRSREPAGCCRKRR